LETLAVTSGGRERTYSVWAPSERPSRAPVLIAYHGHGGTGLAMRAVSGLDAVAARAGALAVYPDALPQAGGAWSLGCDRCTMADALGIDDDRFAVDMLDDLGRRYAIDPARIVVTGHSLGGSFASLLACRHADRLAGAAIVASLLVEEEEAACVAVRPLRYLHLIGVLDPNVPWTGGGRYGYVG